MLHYAHYLPACLRDSSLYFGVTEVAVNKQYMGLRPTQQRVSPTSVKGLRFTAVGEHTQLSRASEHECVVHGMLAASLSTHGMASEAQSATTDPAIMVP